MTSTLLHRPPVKADPALLARLHQGDSAAFAELYQHTAHRLTRHLATRLRDRDVVEDLVQEAFCTALAEPHLLGMDLLGSMLQLAARAVTAHSWSQHRYLRAAYTLYEDRTGDPQPTTVAAEMLRRPAFRDALARLALAHRQVVQLRYLDGCPRDHVAQVMQRSVAAITWLEREGLRRLQAEYASGPR
ncbi:RNA polymerase sigma factor [Actinoplanes sp. NPDC026623]|uniref:RNA polymerase sigma factor n=1 Tax=Actinoplanes sp. NPDC026623 TaxID=3155610 RepID=UPI0033EFF899